MHYYLVFDLLFQVWCIYIWGNIAMPYNPRLFVGHYRSHFEANLRYYCALKCGFAGCEAPPAPDLFYKWFFDSKWARNWKLVSVYFYVVYQIGQFCNLVKRVTESSHPRVYFLHCLVDYLTSWLNDTFSDRHLLISPPFSD